MSLGPNEALIGSASGHDLNTPALLLDRDTFEANLATMAEIVARHGRKLRPHVKAHKSTRIARRQIEAGAVGLCCATVREAEVMAGAGLDHLLVTSEVTAPAMVRRLVAARERIGDLTVVVDSDVGIEVLAAEANPSRPLGVLIELDMGQTRTGVTDPEVAISLAKKVAAAPNLRYRGVQAYYGHLQHIPTFPERLERISEKWTRLEAFLAALRSAGQDAEIISGGGTGTHLLDVETGPFTEVQAGSYVFMDKQYAAVELARDGAPFQRSLTIATRVISSAQPDRVIIDAGLKAMATEAGPATIATAAYSDATYQFMGDEHGALLVSDGTQRPAIGDLITLVAPHCDPTVNLHDRFHVIQGERLVDIWPIDARGY
jgi:D-serine deaminase-like pyridoxal phosphate-dependent protein